MTYQRYVALLRRVGAQCGKPAAEVKKITFNSARRFLPTVASAVGADAHTAQAVGNWTDLPCEGSSKQPALRLMSVHYSDIKALASGQAKESVLDAFVAASSHHPSVQSILAGTPAKLAPGTLTWGAVGQAHRQLAATPRAAYSGSQAASSSRQRDASPQGDGREEKDPDNTGVKRKRGKKDKDKEHKDKTDKKCSGKARVL